MYKFEFSVLDNGEHWLGFEDESTPDVVVKRLLAHCNLEPMRETGKEELALIHSTMFQTCDTHEPIFVVWDTYYNKISLHHASARFRERQGFDIVCSNMFTYKRRKIDHVDGDAFEAVLLAKKYAEKQREKNGWNHRYDVVTTARKHMVFSVSYFCDLFECRLSGNTVLALFNANIRTQKQLLSYSYDDLLAIKGLNKKRLKEIITWLADNGKTFPKKVK